MIGPTLALLLGAVAASANATEPVLARIESVTGGQVTLVVEDPRQGAPERLTLDLADSGLSERARPGLLVRVWPKADKNAAGGRAHAWLTPVHAGRHRQDPTGVRSRLTRGRMGGGRHAGGSRGGR